MGIVTYFKESYNELVNNVTWPTRAEAQKLTITVALFSVIFALVIYGIDTVFGKAIQNYFEFVKSKNN